MKNVMAVILSLALLLGLSVAFAEATYKSDLVDVYTKELITGRAVIDSDGFFNVKVEGVPDGTYLVQLRHEINLLPVLGYMEVVAGEGKLEGYVQEASIPVYYAQELRFWISLHEGSTDTLKYVSGIQFPEP